MMPSDVASSIALMAGIEESDCFARSAGLQLKIELSLLK
jgi:hypothetical protein